MALAHIYFMRVKSKGSSSWAVGSWLHILPSGAFAATAWDGPLGAPTPFHEHRVVGVAQLVRVQDDCEVEPVPFIEVP